MTCIVGIEHDGRVTLGGDSAQCRDSGDISLTRDPKVFLVGDYVFGLAGVCFPFDVVRFRFKPPELRRGVDRTMRTEFIPELHKALEAADCEFKDSNMLVGVAGRLYEVGEDLGVIRARDPYNAIGTGSTPALTTMHNLRDTKMTSREKLTAALEASERFCWSVRRPWRFVTSPLV